MSSDWVTVRLLGIPLDLQARSSEHWATLRRELALVEAGEEAAMNERLVELSSELGDRYGGLATGFRATLDDARAAGRTSIDVEHAVPTHLADDCRLVERLLDEIDDLCRRGELVTLASPPDVAAYRRWFLRELAGQLEGAEPTPWPGADDGAPAPPPSPSSGSSAPIVAEDDLDLLGAPSLRDAISARLEAGDIHLVVDLSHCRFVDSVGLSLLLTTRERCLGLGGSFRVIGVTDEVRALFETVGVLDLLTEGA